MNISELANFIWSLADFLRGDYKQADYGKIILPFIRGGNRHGDVATQSCTSTAAGFQVRDEKVK
jgi:hypothetical protein